MDRIKSNSDDLIKKFNELPEELREFFREENLDPRGVEVAEKLRKRAEVEDDNHKVGYEIYKKKIRERFGYSRDYYLSINYLIDALGV